MNSKRDVNIDISKGIGIMLVIVGHCTIIPFDIVYRIISSFHMPLFFIWGGRLFRSKSISKGFESDFKRLIVPYMFVMSLYVIKFSIPNILAGDFKPVLSYILASVYGSACGHHSLFLSDVPSIHIMWFLPAMFMCRTMYNIIATYTHNYKRYIFAAIISIICIQLDCNLINLPFGILTGGAGLMFFAFGDYLKNKKIPFPSVCILFILWGLSIKYASLCMSNGTYHIFPLAVAGACGGTIFVYHISVIIHKYMSLLSTVFEYAGKYSMIVFSMHFIAVIIDLNTRLSISNWFCWLIIDAIVISSLSYFCLKIPFTNKIFS